MLALARQIGEGEWLETLPDGLHTQVGERGARLSMEQRQLVALMRVLVQRPRYSSSTRRPRASTPSPSGRSSRRST